MISARYIVDGQLTVLTPLSLGRGQEEEAWPDSAATLEPNATPRLEKDNSVPAPIAAIEMDHRGLPFLPGTAIKGLLRSRAATALDNCYEDKIEALLGGLPLKGRDAANVSADVAIGGMAEFHNALLPTGHIAAARPAIRGRTALHEGSRTAEDGQLQHDRIVAPATVFPVTIVLTGATDPDVALLLALMALIDGSGAASAMGAGTSQGDGRVKWTLGTVRRFGQAEAERWIIGGPGVRWQDLATPVLISPTVFAPNIDLRIEMHFTLQIEGPFLVAA